MAHVQSVDLVKIAVEIAVDAAEIVADALEADESDAAWLHGLGLKREHVVDFVQRMRAKRPGREA